MPTNALSFEILDYPALLKFHVNALWLLLLATDPDEQAKYRKQRDDSLAALHDREDRAMGFV